MLDSGVAELNKFAAIDVGLQPAAEWKGARVSMKEAPCLAGLGVVGDVQVLQQIFGDLRFGQLGAADVQHGWCAVWFLIDLVMMLWRIGMGLSLDGVALRDRKRQDI